MCDSRIENAYLRLSNRSGESRSSASTASNRVEHRALSSLSLSAPSRKYTAVDTATRPSSAQDRRSNGSKPTEKPRGILKKTESPVANSGSRHNRSRESLDGWFQRTMHVKKLSPLDLCDVFSYGDARKHPLVPLGHVCEVLFDLDPETATGADPVTDEMEVAGFIHPYGDCICIPLILPLLFVLLGVPVPVCDGRNGRNHGQHPGSSPSTRYLAV